MGTFSGVLLAADYDDTLYDHSFSISQENRRAIAGFLAEGGLFTVATGRSYINFAIQMETEQVPINAPAVLSNGSSIHDFATGETLWQKTLPGEAPLHLAEICRLFPEVGFEAYHGDQVYTHRANTVTRRHLTHCRLEGIPRPIEAMPGPWLKVILQHEDTGYLHRVQAHFQAHWPELYEVTFSNPVLLELTAKGANKGLAVQWLAERLHIQPQHIYCVGNGVNDIPMLEVSAVPFAPADCYEEVKLWGPVLLPPCDHHAIAHLIEILDRRYGR